MNRPVLPGSDRQWFLETQVETGNVSRETFQRINSVIELLGHRHQQINLIGPKEWPQIWQRHVADSLQLIDHIPMAAQIVDLGSGGGFPGLIIAAANPTGHVTMIESVGKKCAFLREAISAAGLSASVRQERVESVPHFEVDIVTARAFAPLPKLLEYSSTWMLNGAEGLFLKGENWEQELTQAQQSWTFPYQTILSRTFGSGVILKIGELSRVGNEA